jgi:hypothetical protein
MCTTSGCPPGDPYDSIENRIRLVAEFWSQLRICDELGATNWRALEPIERLVTECLYRQPPDIGRAESHTALAISMIAGR